VDAILNLDELEQTSTEVMLKAVIGAETLPDGLSLMVHRRTDGNALFNEEIGRRVAEKYKITVNSGIATVVPPLSELRLPHSVRTLIRSRIASLVDDEFDVLCLAAVIGLEFDARLIRLISRVSGSLEILLDKLTKHGFIEPVLAGVSDRYRFNHVLTQEVMYETLLFSQRRLLHANVAHAVEQLFDGQLAEYYEDLAFHYRESKDIEKAIRYLTLSAHKAAKRQLIRHAITQYNAAIELIDSLAVTEDSKRQRIDLSLFSGRLAAAHPSKEIYNILSTSLTYARSLDDDRRFAHVALNMGSVCLLSGRLDEAREHLLACIPVASAVGDELTVAFAEGSFGQTLFYGADFSEAVNCSTRAIESMGRLGSQSSLRILRTFLSLQHAAIGSFNSSEFLQRSLLEETIRIKQTLMEQVVRLWTSYRLLLQGDWVGAGMSCDVTVELGAITQAEYIEGYARCGKCYALFMCDPSEIAVQEFQTGLDILGRGGIKLAMSLYHAAGAEIYALFGLLDCSREHIQKALECRNRKEYWGEVQALRALALVEAQSATPDWALVESTITHSFELAENRGQLPDLAIGRFRYGEILQKNAQFANALEQLSIAEEQFRRLEMAWWADRAASVGARIIRHEHFCGFVPFDVQYVTSEMANN
jgi:predicted ATPase